MNTTFKNIHFKPAPTVLENSSLATPHSSLPRRRDVVNDPAREFAARPGTVRLLPADVHALILQRHEWRLVGRKGIVIEKNRYWSENSITCSTLAGKKLEVLCTYNRHDTSVIHILKNDGSYLETIALAGHADMFDAEQAEQKLGELRRDEARVMKRMNEIHAPDIEATLKRAEDNLAKMQRMVVTLDPPVPVGRETSRAGSSAAQIASAEASGQIVATKTRDAQKALQERALAGESNQRKQSLARRAERARQSLETA